jgi:hypothetical protein
MKAEHTVASYIGRDFTSKIATVFSLELRAAFAITKKRLRAY